MVIGISPAKVLSRKSSSRSLDPADASHDTPRKVMVGASNKIFQEFARIVAKISEAFDTCHADDNIESLVLLMPCSLVSGGLGELRGAALLVVARDKYLQARHLEVSADCNPNRARCFDLGRFELDGVIKKIQPVTTTSRQWCMSAFTAKGRCSLVLVKADQNDPLKVTFARFNMPAGMSKPCLFRSFSPTLIGTLDTESGLRELDVWSALPNLMASESDQLIGMLDQRLTSHVYKKSVLSIGTSTNKEDKILDFRFIPSGSLDGYPWIVLLTNDVAIIHVRPAGKNDWKLLLTLKYPYVRTSYPKSKAVRSTNIIQTRSTGTCSPST
jgi:hypothetical protein